MRIILLIGFTIATHLLNSMLTPSYQLASADRVSGTLSTSCSYSTSTLGPPDIE